jgi:hypothetical protein
MVNQPQLWLGLMLLSLHAAIAWGIDDWWSRAFLLAHFGLFLMWQPVWRGEGNIESRYAVLVVVVGLVFSGLEQLVAHGGLARSAVRPDRWLCTRHNGPPAAHGFDARLRCICSRSC